MTLRTRLSIALAIFVACGTLAFALAARATVEHVLYSDVDRDLRTQIQRTQNGLVDRRRGPRISSAPDEQRGEEDRLPPGALFGRGALIAEVLDADGEVVARTSGVDAIGGMPKLDREDLRSISIRTTRIDGERYRVAAGPTRDDGIVQVARPLKEIGTFLSTLMFVLAAAGAVALVAAVIVGRWAARATLRPVTRMTDTAQRIQSTRDLSERVEPAFPDPELAAFAESVNDMLASLQSANVTQRAFVADASHELRTPLTSLAGNASFLLREDAQLAPDERDAAEAVVRDVDRITRIADGLTTLARLDGTPSVQLEPVDIDAIAATILRRARDTHPEHEFQLAGTAGVVVLDHELIERVLGNLVDNAGRYTPPQSRVVVQVACRDDALIVTVSDDGPGLSNAELGLVSERFHRGSTAAGTSGTGLGLAIATEACAALGGTLLLEGMPEGGLRAVVQLPTTGLIGQHLG